MDAERIAEWDEELIADREHYFHQCDDQACQADQRAARIARAQHAEVARLTADRDLWHRDATKLDALAVEFEAKLSRLRAAVEVARDYLNRARLSETYKEFNDAMLVAQDALDRGLKGLGDE